MKTTEHQRFRIDWVLVDELAIGPAPRAPRHLERLADAGIKAVFSLCGEEEAHPRRSRLALHTTPVLPDTGAAACPGVSAGSPAIASEVASTARRRYALCSSMERSPLVPYWLVKQRNLNRPCTRLLDRLPRQSP